METEKLGDAETVSNLAEAETRFEATPEEQKMGEDIEAYEYGTDFASEELPKNENVSVKAEVMEESIDPLTVPQSSHLDFDLVSTILEETLKHLNLFAYQMQNYLVIQRTSFDLKVENEPYTSIQIVINMTDSSCTTRIWGSIRDKRCYVEPPDLVGLCDEVFNDTVTCLGMPATDDRFAQSLGISCPVQRTTSGECFGIYRVPLKKRTRDERKGIGLCSACNTFNLFEAQAIEADTIEEKPDVDMIELDEREAAEFSLNDDGLNLFQDDLQDVKQTVKKVRRVKRKTNSTQGSIKRKGRVLKMENSKRVFESHKMSSEVKSGRRLFFCDICSDGKEYGNRQSCFSHMRKKHMSRLYQCPFCRHAKRIHYPDDLYEHVFSNHPNEELKAPCCNVPSFTQGMKDIFVNHVISCMKESRNKKAREKARNQGPKKPKPKPWQCEICGFAAVCKSLLEIHMNRHNDIRDFKCDVGDCQFATFDKAALNNHRVRHFDNKTEFCDNCGKSFYTAGELRKHKESIHGLNYGKWKCLACDQIFVSQPSLKHHSNTVHPTNDDLYCKICDKRFGSSYTLSRHIKIVHTPPAYECHFCAKKIKTKLGFEGHLRSHTGENPFKCKYCDYVCKAGEVASF